MGTAAYIHGVRDVRIGEFDPPDGGGASTMVDVAAVGICGSDLHYYKDGGIGSATISSPFIPGHEFSARLSQDVESRSMTKGQLVAVDPATPCHRCEWCRKGHHNLCPNVVFLGAPPYHGGLTARLSVPVDSLFALPEGMTADQGAMLEPLGVCIHAMDLARPRLGEKVAIIGCGPIGLGILQLLVHGKCPDIIAIDPQPHRAAHALALGATAVGDDIDAVRDASDGLGCHLVIEATNSPRGMSDAVKAARIGGRVVLVGIPDGDSYVPLTAADTRRRGLSLKFSRRMGDVYPRAIELVRSGAIDVDALVTHHFPLEDTPDAFAMQADEVPGLIKSIVLPSG